MPVSLPDGLYGLNADAPIWLLRRMSDGTWQAQFPLKSVVGLEVVHRRSYTKMVYAGPEFDNEPWLVVAINGISALVRALDLSEFPKPQSITR